MENTMARFGRPATAKLFTPTAIKRRCQAPAWVEKMGLNAYEYQCGRGVRISAQGAQALGEEAAKHGVALSVHAPYYISLASKEAEKRENSIRYILESARAAGRYGRQPDCGASGRTGRPEP